MAITQIPSEFIAINAISGTIIADNAITAVHIATNAITGTLIADNSVTAVHIAGNSLTAVLIEDNAVGTDQLAGIARGKIIYGDSSGNPQLLALGSSGQVLTSDGSDIAWGTDVSLTTEQVQDIAGGMFSSNTETGITATYQDGDGTIDLVVGTLNQNTTGTAATVTTAAQTAITSVGTLTTLTVDDMTLNGSTITDAGDLTISTANAIIDSAGDIRLDANSDIELLDSGTQYGKMYQSSNNWYFNNPVQDKDILFVGDDGGVGVTALTLDMSEAGAATFSSSVTALTNFNSTSGNDLRLNAGSANRDIFLQVNGTTMMTVQGSTSRVGIGTTAPQEYLQVGAGASSVHGQILISADNGLHQYLRLTNGGGSEAHYPTGIWYSPSGRMELRAASSSSASNAAQLVLAADGNVGIGETSPTANLHISGSGGGDGVHIILQNGGTAPAGIRLLSGHGNWEVVNSKTVGDALEFIDDSAGVTRMIIKNTGNVGINTTAPLSLLHIKSSATQPTLLIQSTVAPSGTSEGGMLRLALGAKSDSGSGNADTQAGDVLGKIMFEGQGTDYSYQGGMIQTKVSTGDGTATRDEQGCDMIFGTIAVGANSQAEKMRLTSAGVLSIGDSTPESGDADSPKNLYCQGVDANIIIKNTAANSSSQRQGICFLNSSGTRVGTIAITSSQTDYLTSSDYRLKENIVTLPNGLTRLLALKPVKFDWKLDGSTSEGFLAHEAQEQFPQAVMGEKDGDAMQAMDYGRITPLLVKAIQEQQTIIEDLKARIETLEG